MKKKTLIATFALAFALTATVFGVTGFSRSAADDELWSEVTFEEYYALGDELTVPSRTVVAGGKTLSAYSAVTYPSGKTTARAEILLDETGEYVVDYYAAADGRYYGASETFSVKGVAYKFGGKTSTASFARYVGYGSDSTGLLVRLANKDSLKFTTIIDMREKTSADSLIRGFVTPDARGSADFSRLVLKFTDVTDENNYLTVQVNKWSTNVAGLSLSFVAAGGNGQDMVGWEVSGDGSVKKHVNDGVGTPIPHSFVAQTNLPPNTWSGTAGDFIPDSAPFWISYDAATNSVFASGKLVADLDNPEYFPNGTWSGFKSGKVQLSVSADGYNAPTANFCILSVAGVPADDLKNNAFTDAEPPVITIEKDYEIMPDARINRPYPVPRATAFDEYSGERKVTARVYTAYGTPAQAEVGISDGKFTPRKLGYYSIVYTAADADGNAAESVLHVYSAENTPDVALGLPADRQTTAVLGELVQFGAATVSGGSGAIKVTVTATLGDKTETINGSYRFETAGEYEIKYVAEDYIGVTAEESYVLTATAGEKPSFINEIRLPSPLISGGEYLIPEYYANDYTSGKLETRLCDVKITDKSGERTIKSGNTFVPQVENNGDEVTLEYVCGSASKTVKIPTVIAKKGKNGIYAANYLYGNAKITALRSGVDAEVETAADSVGWTFANALIPDAVATEIVTYAENTAFDAFEFIIRDYYDADCRVRITLTAKGKIVLSVGAESVSKDLSLAEGVEFGLKYSGGKVIFSLGETTMAVTVKTYADGRPFDGFPSGKVFFGCNVLSAESGAKYNVRSVGGDPLSSRDKDYSSATLEIIGSRGGVAELNDSYTVRAATSYDTFAPNTSSRVTVYAPDGSVMSDINGLKLENAPTDKEYVIRLAYYGRYKIEYSAVEENWVGNDAGVEYDTVFVPDEIAPTVRFTGGGDKKAKLGDVIVMPSYSVNDNVTAKEDLVVTAFVVNPNGRHILLGEANSIKTEYKGRYTFVVYVTDEAGNAAYAEYVVDVK